MDTSVQLDERAREALREALLDWFDHHKRDMPWRGIDDPYGVWVSEIMLQQTQVATVRDYWTRWMARFPDVDALAEAELDEVLEAWAGLGYYRRARMLHRAARQVVDEFDGELPGDVKGLRKLSGIGPYTAGAIASIAFGEVAPLVDGNVERVFARLFAIGGDPKDRANQKQFWAIAEQLVDAQRPGDFNQALMELGATVCTPKSPSCLLCPVRQRCQALALGDPARFPARVKRARQREVTVATLALVTSPGEDGLRHHLAVRRPEQGLLAGLLEFPTTAPLPAEQARDIEDWREHLAALLGELAIERACAHAEAATYIGQAEHVFSHLRMTFHVHVAELPGVAPLGEHARERTWLRADELEGAAFSSAQRKVEALVRGHLGEA